MDLVDYARHIERFFSRFLDDLIQHAEFPRLYGEISATAKLASNIEQMLDFLRLNLQEEQSAAQMVSMRGLDRDREAHRLALANLSAITVQAEILWLRSQVQLKNGIISLQKQVEEGDLQARPEDELSPIEQKSMAEELLTLLNKASKWVAVGTALKKLVVQAEPFIQDIKSVLATLPFFQ